MKLTNLFLTTLSISSLFFTSCGERVEVPTAHVGLVKTGDGIEEEIHEPSSFRLPASLMVKNQLILIETSHFAQKESMRLFMPKDNLNFEFDVRGTYSISKNSASALANKMTAKPDGENDRILEINSKSVYDIYVQPIIRSKVRSIIADYSIQEVMSNLEAVSTKLYTDVRKELEGSPIEIIRLALADAQPPSVIVEAQVEAKRREVAIQSAEADKQVSLKQSEAKLALALKQQEIDLIEAETQVLVEKKLNESVNTAFVTQRGLKILDNLAKSNNKVIFLPQEALTNPSMMIGLTQQAIKNNKTNE